VLGCCRVLTLTPGTEEPLAIDPPAMRADTKEGPVLKLRWRGRPVIRIHIALEPLRGSGGGSALPGGWMRTFRVGRRAKLAGVGPGRYRVHVFDGSGAIEYGFPDPIVTRVLVVPSGGREVALDL